MLSKFKVQYKCGNVFSNMGGGPGFVVNIVGTCMGSPRFDSRCLNFFHNSSGVNVPQKLINREKYPSA